jgi:hypothetical protein
VKGALILVAAALLGAGCGFDVQSPDLFMLTRTGSGGGRVTLLVNDSGTISCNGAKAKTLPDPLLLSARDLAGSLDADAKKSLHIPGGRDSVYRYTVKLQDGTISFPDTAGARYTELARAELFAVQALQGPCATA